MADLSGDGEGYATAAELCCGGRSEMATPHPLTVSGSFKGDGKVLRRRASIRPSLEADEFINLLHGSDPVKVELNRLENEVRGGNVVRSGAFCFYFWKKDLVLRCDLCVFADKDRELGEAQAEIKALKLSERLREKAVEEVACFFFPGFRTCLDVSISVVDWIFLF